MLGRFLEFSLATPDIRASLDFYIGLGFSQAQVGETWSHPYAVVTDGRICLGLHQGAISASTITFVKPDLLKAVQPLELLGVRFESRRLGNDVFNEIGWPDPSGQPIRLIEARTFSPSKRLAIETSTCGYFLEIALPAPNLAESKAYWEQFGFVGMDEPDDPLPHISCTSDYLDLGLYAPAQLRRSALRFELDDIARATTMLRDLGITPATGVAVPLPQGAAVFVAPEGTLIWLSSVSST